MLANIHDNQAKGDCPKMDKKKTHVCPDCSSEIYAKIEKKGGSRLALQSNAHHCKRADGKVFPAHSISWKLMMCKAHPEKTASVCSCDVCKLIRAAVPCAHAYRQRS